jgi:hypothetical protein
LAAEHAFKMLPRHLDFIIRECYVWFASSSKRQIAYKKLYETLNEQSPLKIDKLSGTRWLARQNAIKKFLEQWDDLKLHFEIAKENERCYVADQLFLMLSDRQNYLYMIFLSSCLEKLNAVNKLFQSENADPLKLLEDLYLLLHGYLTILIPPMRLNKIPKHEITSFNFVDYVMDVNYIYFGYNFNKESSNIEQDKIVIVKTKCEEFLVELCDQIQKRIPENMHILQNIKLFTPELATSQIQQPDITDVASTFENLCENVDSALSEWKLIPHSQWSNNCNTESFWVEVAKNTTAEGEQRYGNISKLALNLLCLPFSNAQVERAFSIMNIVKDKLRNKMSVSTLDAIMRVRYNLMGTHAGCINFQPSDNMLKRFNSENIYKCKEGDENAIDVFNVN